MGWARLGKNRFARALSDLYRAAAEAACVDRRLRGAAPLLLVALTQPKTLRSLRMNQPKLSREGPSATYATEGGEPYTAIQLRQGISRYACVIPVKNEGARLH